MPRPKRMSSLFTRRRNGSGAAPQRRRLARRREVLAPERLEGRQLLAVTATQVGGTLTILYQNISGQAATIELEDDGVHNAPATPFTANVNFYSSDTPVAQFFTGVTLIVVSVPNPAGLGVTNNSFAIKGINTGLDRIILAGSQLVDPAPGPGSNGFYSNVAGRWSDETAAGNQCLFTISGIDDLTVTAGGIINVSGTFVNDTGDASIHAIGTIPERAAAQHTATIVVGETTPQTNVSPEPWLFSDTVEVVGGEIDIYANIAATREVTLRAGDSAPADVRSNLVLPYDVIVTSDGTPTGIPTGRVDLFSTKNITQLQTSRIIAQRVVAVSNNDRADAPDGPWMIDLGSVDNAFNEISLGMIAAPGDAVVAGTQGRIGVRNSVALNVVDFGILASTGQVRIDNAGALTVSAPIQATGLILESDDSITTTVGAITRLGSLGIQLYANDTFSLTSTGAITLNGPITIKDDAAPDTIVTNKIEAAGTVTMAGGFFCPLPGSTTITSRNVDVAVTGPIQVGSTVLNANSTVVTVRDHTLALITLAGDISVSRMAGNAVVPHAIQATETISFDSVGEVSIAGSVFSGSMYGNPSKLNVTEALPAITIKALGEVTVTNTGSLRTRTYQTNFDGTTNPLLGLISITEASKFTHNGAITADGAVHIGDLVDKLNGDAYLSGTTTAREEVLAVVTGGIEVEGAIRATGGTYTNAPSAIDQRMPNVILTALGITGTGGISTSGAGTITAGTVTSGGVLTYGSVILTAQQDVGIDAAINTPGTVTIDTALGTVDITALVQTRNAAATPQSVTITAGNGIYENLAGLGFGRIVTDTLTLTNNYGVIGSANIDIDLRGVDNRIGTVTARNFAPGGGIYIANTLALNIAAGGLSAERGTGSLVSLASRAGIIQSGAILADSLSVTNVGTAAIALGNAGNDVDNFAASNPVGAVTYVDADGFETGLDRTSPTLPVEVRGTTVSLSSVEPYSTIRVVSGLAYNSLSIAAGTQSGTTAGTVEFVTTSPASGNATFGGTLRDMIGYVNDNIAVYTANGMNRSQPMAFVFDEAGFPVGTITLDSVLPSVKRPVVLDGGRLEATILAGGQGRLNITQGASSLAYGLAFAPAIPAVPGKAPAYPGSMGSTVRHLAMYGFNGAAKGSALVLGSANNTVTDFYAGLRADGTSDATTVNFVGLDITGTAATNNVIGSTVFDAATVNRFGGNASAGILIRNGASGNKVYGSVIGDPLNSLLLPTATPANGDGVRISAATGNLIGAPDAVQPDQTDSVSNVIAGNTNSGITIVNAIAGSLGLANVVRNNLVSENKVGVAISGSSFAVLGAAAGESGNVIVSQKSDGVTIASSRNIQLFGNRIGVTPTTDTAPESLAGNGGNGVSITGTSQAVEISNGNRISANVFNGVAIGTGVTTVTVAGNTIGGLLDDGVTSAGNGGDGVAINAAVGNTVGVGNTISRNGRHGVSLVDARATSLSAGNRILGSTITDNTSHGVYVNGGSASTIGGTGAADGNVIESNLKSGIYLDRSTKTGAPTGFAIQRNFVGTNTNRDVDAALGNLDGGIVVVDGATVRIEGNTVMNNQVVSGAYDGITLLRGTGTVVGGASAAQGNLIANNARDGVRVLGGVVATQSARSHWITGNTIVDNGEDGVAGNGVTVTGKFATGIIVGQSVTTAGVKGIGNVIQGNAVYGVAVTDKAQQVSIQGNSIADNNPNAPLPTSFGIFIEPGSNESAANPGVTLTKATIRQPSGSQMQILLQGSLTKAVKGQQYTIDVYANPAASSPFLPNGTDPTAQGRRFLGRITVTATANGTIVWGPNNPLRISANVAVGEYITATVTALRIQPGSTSALSEGRIASR